jgi:hypothetical protein
LKEANRLFSALYTRATPEQLEEIRQKALDAEAKIADLYRVLEGGALKNEADLSLSAEARELHAEIFEIGEALRDEVNSKIKAVFAARKTSLESLRKAGEATRATTELATFVHQLTRWSGINLRPASLRPRPIQNDIHRVRVDDSDIGNALGVLGNWNF